MNDQTTLGELRDVLRSHGVALTRVEQHAHQWQVRLTFRATFGSPACVDMREATATGIAPSLADAFDAALRDAGVAP